MRMDVIRKVAQVLNDNKIQYRIRPYSFLGETFDLDGAGWSLSVGDGDRALIKIKRRTKSVKVLEDIARSPVGSVLLWII